MSPQLFIQLVLLMQDYKAGCAYQIGSIDLEFDDMKKNPEAQ